ncbi:MAG: hypothetical protein IJ727_08150, partial [Treponema sp.]|nr:hypothetical protein [Treponema sp.]
IEKEMKNKILEYIYRDLSEDKKDELTALAEVEQEGLEDKKEQESENQEESPASMDADDLQESDFSEKNEDLQSQDYESQDLQTDTSFVIDSPQEQEVEDAKVIQ